MKDLLEAGYIKRSQRYVNNHDGLITQIPSMVVFSLKGIAWLVSNGVVGAKKIYQSMVTYLKKGDKRFPKGKDFDDGSYKPADPEDEKRLNNLLESVTKQI